MPGDNKLKAGSTTACVTSGGAVTSGAAAIANGASNLVNATNLDPSATARLVGAAGAAPAQGAVVALYLVPKADGTNLAGVDTATPYFSPNYFVGNFAWPAAASATSQVMDIDGIPLSAIDYAAYIINSLGQTLSAGWTLTFVGTRSQYMG